MSPNYPIHICFHAFLFSLSIIVLDLISTHCATHQHTPTNWFDNFLHLSTLWLLQTDWMQSKIEDMSFNCQVSSYGHFIIDNHLHSFKDAAFVGFNHIYLFPAVGVGRPDASPGTKGHSRYSRASSSCITWAITTFQPGLKTERRMAPLTLIRLGNLKKDSSTAFGLSKNSVQSQPSSKLTEK